MSSYQREQYRKHKPHSCLIVKVSASLQDALKILLCVNTLADPADSRKPLQAINLRRLLAFGQTLARHLLFTVADGKPILSRFVIAKNCQSARREFLLSGCCVRHQGQGMYGLGNTGLFSRLFLKRINATNLR